MGRAIALQVDGGHLDFYHLRCSELAERCVLICDPSLASLAEREVDLWSGKTGR
jgi:hypothetical protein